MPRKSTSGTTGLVKIHDPDCRNRRAKARPTACRCPWFGRHAGETVQLARWCGQEVDPRELGPARDVFRRMVTAIRDKSFDRAGEHKTRTSGTTFGDYLTEWWKDKCEKQDRPLDTPLPDVENVIATGTLGQTALHDVTTEQIEDWLKAEKKARRWGPKSYNEYRRLIVRFLDRAVTRRTLKFNPARAIERLPGVDAHRGELRHFRLDEEIEAALFAVVDQLNRTWVSPNRHGKLTQALADTIRTRAAAGTAQHTLAREFRVSGSVVSDIAAGKIWNPAARTTTTKGTEMRRRLIAAFDMGPRAGEMETIQLSHVDWAHPKKLVDAATAQPFNGYEIKLPPHLTKGGKRHGETQYLYAGTLRASRMLEVRRFQLKGHPPHQQFVFGTEAGRFVASFKKSWQALYKLAGLDWGRAKGLTWHTTRHEYISRIVENENNPTIAQDAARHKRLETTQRYTHTRRNRVWDAAHRLNRGE